MQQNLQWDLFISHATEDKQEFVEPLVKELEKRGIKIWYDQFSLKLGDSLRRKIDEGLINSRYGVVVLSPHFLEKEWPQKELDGLVSREVNGKKVILPIWHKVEREQILNYSPILADKLGISSKKGIHEICNAIMDVIGTKEEVSNIKNQVLNEYDVIFSFTKQSISQDLHKYSLQIKITNNSLKAINDFKVVFSFPVECIIDFNVIEIARNDYSRDALRYVDFSYTYKGTLYPQEATDILSVGSSKLNYMMNHDLYWKFNEKRPAIEWTLYLREGFPIRGLVDFKELHIF
jgi:hypothetical protein